MTNFCTQWHKTASTIMAHNLFIWKESNKDNHQRENYHMKID